MAAGVRPPDRGPDPDAALAEKALRLGADDPAVRMLDTGLRYLCRQLAVASKTPPTVFAAHLGLQNLDLWIAPPDPNPPRPWQAADGGQVWRLPFAAIAGLDAAEPGGTATSRRTRAWCPWVPTSRAGSWWTWRWRTA